MRLLSLELRNYRKFRQVALEFPQGLIGVLGPNGAGKSTLVEAVAWALYGNKAEIVRTTKEGLRRTGAGPSEPCEAILRFVLDPDEFRIVRRLEGRALTPKVALEINGRLAAQGDEAVAEALLRRLGLDYKAFFTSVFARQKELGALSELDPAERKRLVLRMLQVDTVEDGLRRLASDSSTLSQSVGQARVRLESRPAVEQRHAEVSHQIEAGRTRVAELHGRVTASQTELERLEALRRELEGRQHRAAQMQQELAALEASAQSERGRLEETRKELQQLQEAAEELQELPKIELELSQAEQALNRLLMLEETASLQRERLEQMEALGERNKRAEKERERLGSDLEREAALDQEIAKVERRLKESRKEWQELQRKLAAKVQLQTTTREELEHSEVHLEQFGRLGPQSPCPTCGRPLSEIFDALVRRTEESHENSRKKLHEIQAELQRLEEMRGELERRQSALEKKRQQLAERELHRKELQTKLAAIDAELKQTKAELTKLKAKAPKAAARAPPATALTDARKSVEAAKRRHGALVTLQARVARRPTLEALQASLQTGLGERERRLQELRGTLQGYAGLAQALEKARTDVEAAARTFAEARRDEGAAAATLQQLSDEQGRLQADLGRLSQAAEMLAGQERELLHLAKLGEVLRAFKDALIGRISPALGETASELLGALTGGRYTRLILDEDYTPQLESEGTAYPLARFSGGETDLANLCLRLAVSQTLAGQGSAVALRFVVLDEIFGSQDQDRRRNLLLALSALERERRFDQIFVITHLEEIKDTLPQAILVREDEAGISTAAFAPA